MGFGILLKLPREKGLLHLLHLCYLLQLLHFLQLLHILHLLRLLHLLQLLHEEMREEGQELHFCYLLYLVKLTAKYRDIREEFHLEESEAGRGEGLADLQI